MKSYFRKYEVQRKLFSGEDSNKNAASSPTPAEEPQKEEEAGKELFISDFAFLTLHPEDNIMELTWKGYVDVDDYRHILDESLTASADKEVQKIIFNARNLEAITNENQEWTIENWFPRVKEQGIKTFAFIMPEDIFGEVSLQMIADKAGEEHNIKNKFFPNSDEALAWIKRV